MCLCFHLFLKLLHCTLSGQLFVLNLKREQYSVQIISGFLVCAFVKLTETGLACLPRQIKIHIHCILYKYKYIDKYKTQTNTNTNTDTNTVSLCTLCAFVKLTETGLAFLPRRVNLQHFAARKNWHI